MRKRLWDLAKSRIEIATILPGHRHKVGRKRSGECTPSGRLRVRRDGWVPQLWLIDTADAAALQHRLFGTQMMALESQRRALHVGVEGDSTPDTARVQTPYPSDCTGPPRSSPHTITHRQN